MCLSHEKKTFLNTYQNISLILVNFSSIRKKGNKKWVMRQIKTNVLNEVCKELECFREGGINIYYIPTRLNINLFVVVF